MFTISTVKIIYDCLFIKTGQDIGTLYFGHVKMKIITWCICNFVKIASQVKCCKIEKAGKKAMRDAGPSSATALFESDILCGSPLDLHLERRHGLERRTSLLRRHREVPEPRDPPRPRRGRPQARLPDGKI